MKRGITVLAGLLLAGIAWMQPAAAQGLPPGSYLRTCTGAMLRGDTLVATCRREDGREQRTSLPDVRRCVGEIGNNNGNLQCTYGGGRAGPGPGYEERRYGMASPVMASAATARKRASGASDCVAKPTICGAASSASSTRWSGRGTRGVCARSASRKNAWAAAGSSRGIRGGETPSRAPSHPLLRVRNPAPG